ncbi:hypothetical protein LF41_26 [Lysobacter dokdonensis DS-58]|uniref:Uncharacterized protein n=1 Tax=Lysobacter dokdonensis DS-58 TaxID=1300345 RepID=A0A0A2X6F4_9GAMM|nr:hypothetical protein [Lysobacter dokdonensis]KGQ20819.1 hypothetical protein LF41_26 [Lysobacter dokdonensis DS-58]
MSDAPAAWDDFQREMLDALGHVVYRVQAAEALEDTPLTQAIARAAKTELASLPRLLPLAQLRTPAGKRAVWPQLRALRKAART